VAPATAWADDRITRVVQECIARADHRWQTRALVAWDRGEPIPERDSDGKVMQECMSEPARALAGENAQLKERNVTLEARVGELGGERDALRARADDAGTRLLGAQEKLADKLLTGQERMAEYLGEAAKKSSQPAVATATATSASDGAMTTDLTNPSTPAAVTSPPGPSVVTSVRAPPARGVAPDRCDPGSATGQRRARSPKGAQPPARDAPCPPVSAMPAPRPGEGEAKQAGQ
jgi:hypothetical protein